MFTINMVGILGNLWLVIKLPFRGIRFVWMLGFVRLPEGVQNFMRKHRKKLIAAAIILFFLTWGYRNITKEPAPEIITATVELGDLEQTVEAIGEVTSERDLNLQFPTSGAVEEILVKEGDVVKAGDKLAALRARNAAANVESALASLAAARAELTQLREGTRPEDLAISEALLANKRAELDAARKTLVFSEEKIANLKKGEDVNIMGRLSTSHSESSKQLSVASTALSVFEDVVSDPGVIDAFLKEAPGKDRLLKNERDRARKMINDILDEDFDITSYKETLDLLQRTRRTVSLTSSVLEELFMFLNDVVPLSTFSRASRESRKSSVATQTSALQTSLSSLDSAIKSLQDTVADSQTSISSEEAIISDARGRILTLEASIRTSEAELALKQAGARPTEISVAESRVRQAQAEYNRAASNFEDTILYAPVDGFITKVNIKTGELLSTSFQQDAAITMLGESPYRIEMYASEVDIPKIQLSQSGSLELDAFPGKVFDLVVAEVDPAATSVDGVPKYRLKLDFITLDDGFKIGMTGDVDIVTGRVEGVLTVPARAVYENEFGDTYIRIQKKSGEIEERRVEIGLEGENDVEIVKGVEEGETVVVLMKS